MQRPIFKDFDFLACENANFARPQGRLAEDGQGWLKGLAPGSLSIGRYLDIDRPSKYWRNISVFFAQP